MPPERLNQRGWHPSRHVHGVLLLSLVFAGCQLPTGSPTFAIRFDEIGGEEAVTLEITDLRARAHEGGTGFGGESLFATGGPAIGDVLTR